MDTDRPHFRSSTTAAASSSELFICLTSRRSSSMKLSKPIPSPARPGRDASLSRRLRPNGSLKSGQASPFFPSTKKRGCGGFDNPEPSSPKVTCIGQVRVKSKKKKPKPIRSREVSFRKFEGGDDGQECRRWVHLPISICEALRTFGAEFSCLFPCRSSCFSAASEREEESGCGAVLARWLVAEGGKTREIELIVGRDEDDNEEEERKRASRRHHVFEDIEVKDDRIEMKGKCESESARVSICIPPKNALLLMRCGSDQMKMAALANRFSWAENNQDDEAVEEDHKLEEEEEQIKEVEAKVVESKEVEEIKEFEDIRIVEKDVRIVDYTSEIEEEGGVEETESNMSSFEALLDKENAEDCCRIQVEGEETSVMESDEEVQSPPLLLPQEEEELSVAVVNNEEDEDEKEKYNDEENEVESVEIVMSGNKEKEGPLLPECLLLMMCEPKLSMEVSRETWVCSTDFTRWLPERPRRAAKAGKSDYEPAVKRRLSVDSKAKPINERSEPPRSSCSLPAAAAMASMIEQKLVAYEPFVLTRCKSEPMRTAAGKLAPESCFWNNVVRKLEPVGAAAGVGF